jgi:hypothetical protein
MRAGFAVTGKSLAVALLAVTLLGCGSGEEPAASAPADLSAGGTKGAAVTKPSNAPLDGGSAEAVANEERGG